MKAWLIILGILMVLAGIWNLIPSLYIDGINGPLWLGIVEIAIGLITFGVAFSGGKSE